MSLLVSTDSAQVFANDKQKHMFNQLHKNQSVPCLYFPLALLIFNQFLANPNSEYYQNTTQ